MLAPQLPPADLVRSWAGTALALHNVFAMCPSSGFVHQTYAIFGASSSSDTASREMLDRLSSNRVLSSSFHTVYGSANEASR
jgi:hypothetical protein